MQHLSTIAFFLLGHRSIDGVLREFGFFSSLLEADFILAKANCFGR
jgi:hypothetical protein